MEQITVLKAQMRKELRRARRQLDGEELSRESARLCRLLLELPELQRAKTVFCYVSCGGEVETHGLIRDLLARGKRVLVPRCKGDGIMDCVAIESLDELCPGAMGILEPSAEAPAQDPAAVEFTVVPAVACGEDGSRLGQGGGYYDRFLERVNCDHAAVCLERFLLPAVPSETHDRKMKCIVTQRRVLRFEVL